MCYLSAGTKLCTLEVQTKGVPSIMQHGKYVIVNNSALGYDTLLYIDQGSPVHVGIAIITFLICGLL